MPHIRLFGSIRIYAEKDSRRLYADIFDDNGGFIITIMSKPSDFRTDHYEEAMKIALEKLMEEYQAVSVPA